jgi:hypothetical protein
VVLIGAHHVESRDVFVLFLFYFIASQVEPIPPEAHVGVSHHGQVAELLRPKM